jgi:hypothetical protein
MLLKYGLVKACDNYPGQVLVEDPICAGETSQCRVAGGRRCAMGREGFSVQISIVDVLSHCGDNKPKFKKKKKKKKT